MAVQESYGLNSLQSLKSLSCMLRDNADKILAGEMSVTITNTTLYQLNEAVDNLQDGLSPSHLALGVNSGDRCGGRAGELEDWNFYLQLVLDVISTAPVLVLYKGKNHAAVIPTSESSAPVSHPLRLGYFTSLNHLEISSVPVQSIQDLLKMRERLQTLVVVNCFSSSIHLQDVLEMCDQEVSVPMQWTVLTTLVFRGNGLTELDGSLRLCPRLEMLDLSRNRLVTTDVYLGYLMELIHVDLSYNCLTVLPSVSATAKKKLRVLRLCGNKLTSLLGVEEMTSLQELDISENLISSHHCLNPVKGLHRLDRLNMRGCPASMRKDHRTLTLQYISTVSLSRKFCLDGYDVTHKEIQTQDFLDLFQYSRAVIQHSGEHPGHARHRSVQVNPTQRHSLHQTDGSSHQVRSHTEPRPDTGDDLTVGVTSTRKKRSRRRPKARTMDIADMDVSTGGELSSKDVTPCTTPKPPSRMEALAQQRRQEVQERRAEMEHLRNYYGESWLQAVVDQGIIPPPAPMNTTTDSQSSDNADQTGKKSPAPLKSEADSVSGRGIVTSKGGVHAADASLRSNLEKRELQVEEGKPGSVEKPNSGAQEKAFSKDTMFLSSGSGAEDGAPSNICPSAEVKGVRVNVEMATTNSPVGEVERTGLREEGKLGLKVETDDRESDSREPDEQETDKETSETLSPTAIMYSSQNSTIEPEDQSEPFIVTLAGKSDSPFLLSVSPRYLIEKDINGHIQDKLDLQSLENVSVDVEKPKSKTKRRKSGSSEADIDPPEVRLVLEFSYVRKDRRHRTYVMEDFASAQQLSELVQPFVDAKVEAAMKKLQVQCQCLKCNSHFTRGEASTVVHVQNFPRTGSAKDFVSMTSAQGQKEILRCPKCRSDHVVQLETEDDQAIVGNISSSLPSEGVLQSIYDGGLPEISGRKQSVDQLTSHSPQAHSTPSKQYSHSPQTTTPKGSGSHVRHNLFTPESQSPRDGLFPRHAAKSDDLYSGKLDGEAVQRGRQRSNAFYNQPAPGETRQRSGAVASSEEFLERHASGSVTSAGSDVERTRHSVSGSASSVGFDIDRIRSSASNSFTSASAGEMPQLDRFHLPVTGDSVERTLSAKTVVSSVESDIAILNKRDSVASVTVLSSTAVPSEGSLTEVTHQNNAEGNRRETVDGVFNSQEETNKNDQLKLLQAGADSVEVTPMGSPLSSSICSSMVSSVYHNSLLPNTSASSVYATASDYSQSEEGADTSHQSDDDKDETMNSIYNEGEPAFTSAPHKVSISSEVEVLLVEENSNTSLNRDEGDAFLSSAIPALDGGESATSTTTPTEVAAEADGSVGDAGKYDFKRLDHRLALHLMMSVYDNNEEFSFKVETTVCQYMMQEEYSALVTVTNLKLYILRINRDFEDDSVELGDALTLMEAQPHAELRRVGVGLGRQTLRVEYISDCSSYTLVLRDRRKVDMLAELLSEQVQTYGIETGVSVSAVFDEEPEQQTLDTLAADVLNRGADNQTLRLYILGYISRGHNPVYPVAFVVSSQEMCLVKPNHQWPSPHHQTPITVDTVGKQFTVLERQKINNIATVVVHEQFKQKLLIAFFNESSGDETKWSMTMENSAAVRDVIDAVREPWETEFGVEMDVELSAYELSF